MLATVRELMQRLRRYDKDLRQLSGKQVFAQRLKSGAKAIVDIYFRDMREQLIIGGITDLTALDAGMQRLLGVAQKNSAVATYRGEIKTIEQGLLVVEKQALMVRAKPALILEPIDRLIMDTLASMLPSAARSYEQAISDLHGQDRLSWRGPATDLRESLRETLDHLAPDQDVMQEPGFKTEKDTSAPTMKQKVRFILRKRGVGRTAMQSPEAATQAVDELVGTFVRGVYSRSSVSTHTPTDRDEILRLRDWVRVALCELLQVRVGG